MRDLINLIENAKPIVESESYEDFHEQMLEMAQTMVREYKTGSAAQKWTVVPARKLIAVWKSSAKLGFVRDERGLDAIAGRFIENTIRLAINTDLAEHGTHSTEEVLEFLDIADEIDDPVKFVSWAVDTPTGWRISDYGLPKLIEYALKLLDDPDSGEKLMIIDAMMNITHQRSDLASWFVEGGAATLDSLAND